MAAVEHETGNFLNGKLGGQVFGTFPGRLPPVLVHVQFPVPVKVLEGVSVRLQDGGRCIAQGSTLFLGDEFIAIGLGFLPGRAAGTDSYKCGGKSREEFCGMHGYGVSVSQR